MQKRTKFHSLEEIFNDDEFYLIEEKKKVSQQTSADQRLLNSFQEINKFVDDNNREPQANLENISEFQLYSRLDSLRKDPERVRQLKSADMHNLLPELSTNIAEETAGEYQKKTKEIKSLDDILSDDISDFFDDDSLDLFTFNHTPKNQDREQAEFIARRKPCKDFEKYEQLLKNVQKELAAGKRKLIDFNQNNLQEKAFYVHNGVLFYLEKINISHKEHYKKDGTRVREDGRTRCIFENGTESNMLKRSVEKILYANGKVVTQTIEDQSQEFQENFSSINDNDTEAGLIYVLQSLSNNEEIQSINNLFKIGYTSKKVEDRIKNAANQPTYLMADVRIVETYKCFKMNPQKLEQLLHNFFGNCCLEIDVFDKKGKRHTPREWFIVPFEVIEQAIELIINRKIVNYKYDNENFVIVVK